MVNLECLAFWLKKGLLNHVWHAGHFGDGGTLVYYIFFLINIMGNLSHSFEVRFAVL
jgi:hypothetical protein